MSKDRPIMIAGHICVDIIPDIPPLSDGLDCLVLQLRIVFCRHDLKKHEFFKENRHEYCEIVGRSRLG